MTYIANACLSECVDVFTTDRLPDLDGALEPFLEGTGRLGSAPTPCALYAGENIESYTPAPLSLVDRMLVITGSLVGEGRSPVLSLRLFLLAFSSPCNSLLSTGSRGVDTLSLSRAKRETVRFSLIQHRVRT